MAILVVLHGGFVFVLCINLTMVKTQCRYAVEHGFVPTKSSVVAHTDAAPRRWLTLTPRAAFDNNLLDLRRVFFTPISLGPTGWLQHRTVLHREMGTG